MGLVPSSQRGRSPSCRRRWTGSKMSSSTRRRSSRPSPTNSTRPSLKCPVTENKNCSVLQLSLTSYLPVSLCIFCSTRIDCRCCFYLDRHELQATDQTLDHWTPLHLQTLPHKCQPTY